MATNLPGGYAEKRNQSTFLPGGYEKKGLQFGNPPIPFLLLSNSCLLFLLSISSPLCRVVNDLLNPAGQNLRIREDLQV
ncbi:hypothetical protein IEQ34_021661 [Dendrobium chrysotoxum]|uniref:Uncharacterized protein n=1 Tax=Dendrobium chrysotoxum TaxID=161865 RepID=A0AAV7G4R3_DENCH|nr:hypothetical protein IEQ34_021661 [Dendrobium chrysotoxum]